MCQKLLDYIFIIYIYRIINFSNFIVPLLNIVYCTKLRKLCFMYYFFLTLKTYNKYQKHAQAWVGKAMIGYKVSFQRCKRKKLCKMIGSRCQLTRIIKHAKIDLSLVTNFNLSRVDYRIFF